MESILTALIGGLCVAIPNIIATISANKKNNLQDLEKNINKTIKDNYTSVKSELIKIRNDLTKQQNKETLSRCKVDLVNVMSRVQNNYILTEEERRILIEEKEEYNKLGGDSYVDDMFDRLKKEGKLWKNNWLDY